MAILFAGGAAPAANAVISAAATAFLRSGTEVLGIQNGFSRLVEYRTDAPLCPGEDYVVLDHSILRRTRNAQGVLIGTSRVQPGKEVTCRSHLQDSRRAQSLRSVYEALCSLNVEALISIGGDGTLETVYKLKLHQEQLSAQPQWVRLVHVPKAIDNDYRGIDFALGYFTAVNALAGELRNLLHDAQASGAYFIVETVGRSAAWLPYGAAIAGEATLVLGVEDIVGRRRETEERIDPQAGEGQTRPVMEVECVVEDIVELMLAREAEGKRYGVIVIAEGLADLLPARYLGEKVCGQEPDLSTADIHLGRLFAGLAAERYREVTGRGRKVTGLRLGYDARSAKPHAFDVLLGSQLGVGAYRALVEEDLDGVMVSVSGQLDLGFEPFEKLVHPHSLAARKRYIEQNSDFYRLARFLETGASGLTTSATECKEK